MRVTFGPFRFDGAAFRLERDGQALPVQPKVLEALALLLARAGTLVTREELTSALWPDVIVTEQSLRQVMRKLRDALGDDEKEPTWVENVRGRGYRFVGAAADDQPAPDPAPLPFAERDAFVGRADDLAALDEAVRANRCVTVLGVGGVGKTRLVQRFLGSVGDRFGVRLWCPLHAGRTAAEVIAALATALGVDPSDRDPVVQLGRALAARGPSLVALDNLEQVVGDAAPLLSRWLDLAPRAHFVLTSRVRTGVAAETVVPLGPLPTDDAVALFRARAPRIAEGDHRELVGLLDHLPLAIELAAARSRILAPAEIRARLEQRFTLLGAAPGVRSLLATLDWSWALLGARERRHLTALSVFDGAFTLDRAAVVLDDDPLDVLQELSDRSLVERSDRGAFLLHAVREYARQAGDPGELAAATRRHADHFSRWGRPDWGVALDRSAEVYDAARAELPELLTACGNARKAGWGSVARDALVGAWQILVRTESTALMWGLAEDVLRMSLSGRERLDVVLVGVDLWTPERDGRAVGLAEEAVALAEGLGDRSVLARSLVSLGVARSRSGALGAARETLERALATLPTEAPAPARALALSRLGTVMYLSGQPSEGLALAREANDLVGSAPDRKSHLIRSALVTLLVAAGCFEEARVLLGLALEVAVRGRHGTTHLRQSQVALLHFMGEHQLELRLADELVEEARASGSQHNVLAATSAARAAIDLGLPDAERRLRAAIADARRCGTRGTLARATAILRGLVQDPAERAALAAEATELGRIDRSTEYAVTLLLARTEPDLSLARRWFEQALEQVRATGELAEVAVSAAELALLDPPSPAADEAIAHAVGMMAQIGNQPEFAHLVAAAAERAERHGDLLAARRWIETGRAAAPQTRGARRLRALAARLGLQG